MTSTPLKSSSYPKMLSSLMHSNQFLKMFSLSTLCLLLVSLFLILFLINRDPIILTFSTDGKTLERSAIPKPEDLIKEGIKNYLENRYIWNESNVQKKLRHSEYFIEKNSLKAFNEAMINVAKFSIEKKVSQRIYPSSIEINLKEKIVTVTGERISTIQGLKAVGDLKLQLSFESGPRTNENPWGIYITKEKEIL